ncbi:MAG: hypothetical protein CMN30_18555 [Sandaracinus sp.]|nr:hypothetical protein [Sandaracinus sp.]|tara:strand:- start:942 stop:1514 length:573 start_codon:yes stop_codon:yes gene_type:complete
MVAEPVREMSYAEYLAFEEAAEQKHEYVNGVVYAMAGGTLEHARLAARLGALLGGALAGKPCDVFSSDARVRVAATGRSTYPDATVVCAELVRAEDDPEAIANPTVLVEVLSPTTESSDRGEKWAHYQLLPSLHEYVLVSQEERRVEIFRRSGPGEWSYRVVTDGAVELESLSVSLDLEALYHDPLASRD